MSMNHNLLFIIDWCSNAKFCFIVYNWSLFIISWLNFYLNFVLLFFCNTDFGEFKSSISFAFSHSWILIVHLYIFSSVCISNWKTGSYLFFSLSTKSNMSLTIFTASCRVLIICDYFSSILYHDKMSQRLLHIKHLSII